MLAFRVTDREIWIIHSLNGNVTGFGIIDAVVLNLKIWIEDE